VIEIEEALKFQKQKGYQKSNRNNFAQVNTTVLIFTSKWAEPCYFTYALWYKFASRFTT